MFLLTLFCLLGAFSSVLGAAFIPFAQFQDVSSSSASCMAVEVTFISTVTETVTSPPEIVTIALENLSQLSASISSDVSIENMYWSIESELAPIPPSGAPTFTTIHELTVTEVVPVVEATHISLPSANETYYFLSVGINTTDWLTSYTPTENVTLGVTTITLSPLPASVSVNPTTTLHSTIFLTETVQPTETSTMHSPFPLSTGGIFSGSNFSSGWNATQNTPSTLASEVSGSFTSLPTPDESNTTTTIIEVTVGTTTVDLTQPPDSIITSSPTISCNESEGYDSSYADGIESGTDLGKRQICTLVFATINGDLVSWCNNWDGSSVIIESTYTSTFTPAPYASNTHSTSTGLSKTQSHIVLSPTNSESTPTTTTSSAMVGPTSCGVNGNFVIGFDDLPEFSPANNDTADFPPIFNPYDDMFWSDGWAYVPPPNEPFPPQSGDHLAEYIPSEATNSSTSGSPDAGDVPNAALGAGPRNYLNAYWFNAYSAYVGCDNGATDSEVVCDFVATGYKYDSETQQDRVVVTEHFPQPPCANFKNCQLGQIFFNSQFQGLSALSFYAIVQGKQVIFFLDTLQMGWWNSTCAAGLERSSGR